MRSPRRNPSLAPFILISTADFRFNASLYQNYRDPAYPKVTFDVLAVRTASHKYVENDHNPDWTQLFDLTADPGENHNLAKDPESAVVLAEMKAELERLKEESGYTAPPPGRLK